MFILQAVLLEKEDVTDPERPMESLTDKAFDACLSAHIVIFDNRLVKNRVGPIGAITPNGEAQ
jgi:hypothetical protein